MAKSTPDKPDVYRASPELYLCECTKCGDPGPCRRWVSNTACRLCTRCHVTVSGSILQLADDDSTSTLNLEKKRRDNRLWWLASVLIFIGALV
jgi:hypothetical protein